MLKRLKAAADHPSWTAENLDTLEGCKLEMTNTFLQEVMPEGADAATIDPVRDLNDAIRQNKAFFDVAFTFRSGEHLAWLEEWTNKAKEHSLMLEAVSTTVRSMLTDVDEIEFSDLITKVKEVDAVHASQYTEDQVTSLLKEVEAGQTDNFFAADDPDDPTVISKL